MPMSKLPMIANFQLSLKPLEWPERDRFITKEHVERGVQRVIVFTEFLGPSSFAGKHVQDEPKVLFLIDANLFKRGLMKPRLFTKTFGDLPWCAQVIYDGNLNKQFIQDVRDGKYPVWEGVVAKGDDFMVKIKTDAYRKRLIEVYKASYMQYWE